MDRIYTSVIKEHLQEYRQMVFLAGPRQVGKTVCCKVLESVFSDYYYLNWDNSADRRLLIQGTQSLADYGMLGKARESLPLLVLDEIHKYRKWKQLLPKTVHCGNR